jgi:predicted Zn-dependent protease
MRHPNSTVLRAEQGCSAYYAGLFEESEAAYRELMAEQPSNMLLYWGVGRALNQMPGRRDDAIAIPRQGLDLPEGDWPGLEAELAYALACDGQREESIAILTKMQRQKEVGSHYVDPYLEAIVHAGLEHTEALFAALRQAADIRSTWLPSLIVDPKFVAYLDAPDVKALLREMRFPE